ncbi:MAG: hypothetical protein WAQ33_16090 [Gaiellaceae bacterium]
MSSPATNQSGPLRRINRSLDAQSFFEAALYARLPWPGKTTRLERDSIRDLTGRAASAQIAVAELYHENSKLFRAKLPELAASELDVSVVRREFVRRRATGLASMPPRRPEHPVRELLSSVAHAVEPELFYALDLRLVLDGSVMLHEPVGDVLVEYKRLIPDDREDLRTALEPFGATGPADEPLLFIVASFARNELLFGARGYRHTLLEAGQLANELLRLVEGAGMTAGLLFDFDDWKVDAALEADGVEEGAVAVVELGVVTGVG